VTQQDMFKKLLNENSGHINKAAMQLSISYERCSSLMLSEQELKIDEQEKLEALTSRFARLADLIIQKTIRLIEHVELENTGSVLDRINKAEKKGFINSAEQFVEIRLLRNSIAHEYDLDSILEIFKSCLTYTPVLLNAVKNIQEYLLLHPHLILR